jgi:hypothetical protein
MTEVDFYINFVIHAILGRLAEADALMCIAGDEIRDMADALAHKRPVAAMPIYRGILLDPEVPYDADPKLKFLSWSEDRDVALWFACPRSVVSEPLAQQKPQLRGYVAKLETPRSRVLFHYTWANAQGDLAAFALQHPLMGAEGARQIAWSLLTQREIITEPVADLQPDRVPDLSAPALQALERRLAPPWIIAEEGIRR